jgi:hypothetical protein
MPDVPLFSPQRFEILVARELPKVGLEVSELPRREPAHRSNGVSVRVRLA